MTRLSEGLEWLLLQTPVIKPIPKQEPTEELNLNNRREPRKIRVDKVGKVRVYYKRRSGHQ